MHRLLSLAGMIAALGALGPSAVGCSATRGREAPSGPETNASHAAVDPSSGLLGLNLDPRFGKPCEAGHASLDQLRYLGVNRVRVHPTVLDGETFDDMLAAYRGIVKRYRDAGIHVLAVVNEETVPGAPRDVRIGDWARSNPAAWSQYKDAFAQRIGELAAELGDGVAYEAWNEPDDNWHDDGGDGHFEGDAHSKHLYPKQFAELVTRTTEVVHARSNAKVLSGGLSSGDAHYLDKMGPFDADGVAIHFYNIWAGDDLSSAPKGVWFNVIHAKTDEYRASAGGRGLYLTEWGTQQINYDATADLVRRFFGGGYGDALEEAYFFAWCGCQDDIVQSLTHDGRNANLGLLQAWREAASVSERATFASRCLPDASLQCDDDSDPGCFLAENLTCEVAGNGACGGVGPSTSDCDHCCVFPAAGAPPPPPPPVMGSCHCEGQDQNGDFVATDACNDVTCSTDGQLWICEPGSVDYQPTGDFSACGG